MLINERMKLVREDAGDNITRCGERVGISRSAMSMIESGVNKPSNQTIELFCREYAINREWLETGEGERDIPKSKYEHIARITAALMKEKPDSFKNRFVRALSELGPEEWEYLEKFINSLK